MRDPRQRHFKAGKQGTRVHVVLDQGVGDDDIADCNAAIPGASHACEQDVGNPVLFHKQRGSHCPGHFTDARQDAHGVDAP